MGQVKVDVYTQNKQSTSSDSELSPYSRQYGGPALPKYIYNSSLLNGGLIQLFIQLSFVLSCFQLWEQKDTVFINEMVPLRGQDEDLRDHPAERHTGEMRK